MSRGFKRSLAVIGVAVAALGGILGMVSFPVKTTAVYLVEQSGNPTFVRRDTFTDYRKTEIFRDSLFKIEHNEEIRKLNENLARLDSSARCSRKKKPSWCE